MRARPGKESKDLARRSNEPPARQESGVEASLQIVAGPGKGESMPLTRMVTLIGRQDSCDIVLPDQTASREHGQIERTPDGWVYTNVSENGTYVNRKRADRASLQDGDVLEVGAETRLKFVLTRTEPTRVAPVRRRRARRSREEMEAEELEEEQASPSGIGSLFQRRRKLLIGLGAYVLAMAIVGVVLKVATSDGDGAEESVRAWSENDIRRSLDLSFGLSPDPTVANRRLREAKRYYQDYPHGDPMSLYKAIVAFQQSKEYRGGTDWPDPQDGMTYFRAKKTLGKILWELYNDALMAERRGETNRAREFYGKIQRRISAANPFYQHVKKRLRRL